MSSAVVVVVLSPSVAGKVETYTDVHIDVTSWICSGSPAYGKANLFFEGAQVEPTLNQHRGKETQKEQNSQADGLFYI